MKRMSAILMSCLLVIGLFSGCTAAEKPAEPTPTTAPVIRDVPEVKYHTPAETFAGGSGTEEDPYQISNAAELVLLNKLIVEEDQSSGSDEIYTNAAYILTADISLNDTANFESWGSAAPEYGWEPIGKAAALGCFSGVFDGNGHTISGLYINTDAGLDETAHRNYGLFAEISGAVRNLTIDQSYICISGNMKNVGTVAGYMIADGAVIENCAITAALESFGSGNAGGIIGMGDGKILECRFSGTISQIDENWSHLGGISGSGNEILNCVNLGTVSGSGYSGGIVGYGSKASECVNKGTVTGSTAGGITGAIYRTGTGLEITETVVGLWNSVNEGQINAVDCAGGIVGKIGNSEVDIDMYVSGCENFGSVHCDQSAAGIIGNLSVEQANVLNVENCINHADITCLDKVGGIICDLTGGILSQKGSVTIRGCENRGKITSTEGMHSGGIVTYFMLMSTEVDLNLTIEKCTNSGSIVSPCHAGGILGFSTSLLGVDEISETSLIAFRGCTNTGDILGQSSNSFVGGIAGNFGVKGIATIFEDCTNSGNIRLEFSLTEDAIQETLDGGFVMSISQMVGGIVGRLGEGVLLTTDNDAGNAANVKAKNAQIIFRNCHNTGVLETTDYSNYLTADGMQIWKNYIGGIIGNTCAEKEFSFLAENCTYTGSDRGLGNTEYPDVGQRQ